MVVEWIGIIVMFLVCLLLIITGVGSLIYLFNKGAEGVRSMFFCFGLFGVGMGIWGIWITPVKGVYRDSLSYYSHYFIITPISNSDPDWGIIVTNRDTLQAYKEFDIRIIKAYQKNNLTFSLNAKYNIFGQQISCVYKLQY